MGTSEDDIRRRCAGATVEKGLAIHGANVALAADSLVKWL